MGRELVLQLVADGCRVAMCDISEANMAETKKLAGGGDGDAFCGDGEPEGGGFDRGAV